MTCAFPGIGADWCAWFGPALLLAAVRSAGSLRAAMLGLLAGFVHFVTLLYWLAPTMHRYGPMPWVLSLAALLLLAFYLALYPAAFSLLVTACARRRLYHPLWIPAMTPVFWVSLEWLRGRLFSGFPWGMLGYSQYSRLHLIQIADIAGVYGVSFLVAAVNASVFVTVLALAGGNWQAKRPAASHAALAAVLAAVLIAGACGYGSRRLAEVEKTAAAAPAMNVAVIQGNIEQSLKWDEAFKEHTTRKYIRLSRQVLAHRADLVVWPETALPFYFFHDKALTGRVLEAVDRADTWFLIGSPAYEYQADNGALRIFNSAYLVDPDGRVAGRYDKVHLVPFGEYVPLRTWLPFLGKMVPQAVDFSAGKAGQLLDISGIQAGVQVCYEIIFPELSAAMVRSGGDLLVNITNDAWFGKTAAPWQHFSMGVLRAVENRRTLVRAANTGISGYIDPCGRVAEASAIFETRAMLRPVPAIKEGMTFYTRRPGLLPWTCAALALVFAALCTGRAKREA